MSNVYQNWFLASRPWSFTMTFISVSVGGALAAIDGIFSWPLYLITLVAMIAFHAATNLLNDYFDVQNGVDTLDTSTAQYRPHPLLEGKLQPQQVRQGVIILYLFVALAGIALAAARGWIVLFIGLIGAFASIAYTAPPFKYKYHALGELSVFLMWGPLMIGGAYFVQHQTLSPQVLWVSLPFGALVALVILVNNLRDMVHDHRKGVQTLPLLIGQGNGIRLYVMLIILAYGGILWMSFVGPLHLWSLLVLLSLPLAYRLLKQMAREIPVDADVRTAQLDTVFGTLLVISLVLGAYF
ncbi:MAG: 1,4-dihydroxy-2-naphthoate octaprenyltransferase [Beggiatoa sp. IS2]|nr:MAG: 1,4-dihydroxy-2-naphthoate octaprenyltransferase [Beggiatoa sp. IS2]